MFRLPGASEERDLLHEESERMLDIMASHTIDSPEYALAFARFKEIHAEELEEKKLKEMKHGRWFDTISTFILAGVTLSYEYWAPITSKWGSSITRSFKHGMKMNFRQPK